MIAIINGKLYTMAGDLIEKGTLLLEDGKIQRVGEDIQIPEDATVIDAEGHMVTPGLVDAHSHIGIGEEGIGFEGQDYNEMTNPITPHMRAIDGIYPDDKGFIAARQGGVTTAVTGPGSANAMGGWFCAIKTYGTRIDDMVVKNPVAMKIAFGENVKRVYRDRKQMPMSRMGIMAVLREFMYEAIEYKKGREQEDESKRPAYNLRYESILPVLRKEIHIKAHAHRNDDIFSAIRFAKEFDVDMTLDHCTEGHLIAEELGKEGYTAICGPSLMGASKYELRNKSFITPAALYEQGVKVAIMTDNPFVPSAQLALCAGLAHRSGLPLEEALKTVTINAAEITGIEDRVGSLEEGKDADVVIWSKNPITDIDCEPLYTIIDGNIVFEKGKDETIGR